MDAIYI